MSKRATIGDTLIALYRCVNGPVKAGHKYVTYTRQQSDAMMDVLKQLMVLNGFEFREPK